MKSGSTIKAYYLYDATGRKLNTRNPSQTTSFDYLGSLVLAQAGGAHLPGRGTCALHVYISQLLSAEEKKLAEQLKETNNFLP